MKILFKQLRADARIPRYETAGAAGADLSAAMDMPVPIEPGGGALIPCGFEMALPPGYEAQIRPRSGLAFRHGITVLNAPGTIDADYRGEIGVLLYNTSNTQFVVNPGDRIAQMVIASVWQMGFDVVDELPETERGTGGFGSTGVNAA